MKPTFLTIFLFNSIFVFHSCTNEEIKNVSPVIAIEQEPLFSIDTFQTSLANFISGIDKSYYDSI